MGNPYDPSVPLYEGQQVQAQPQQQVVMQPQPNPQAAGLHFLSGIGELVMGAAYFFSGGNGGDEAEEQEPPSRRGVRPRFFGANSKGRVGKKPCCRRPAGR